MGFQFNHVGGGTKTRRPITLHMKYNTACIQPHCFLITDEFGEQEASLEELQVHRTRTHAGIGELYPCPLLGSRQPPARPHMPALTRPPACTPVPAAGVH